jgi:hypothetical protein
VRKIDRIAVALIWLLIAGMVPAVAIAMWASVRSVMQ